MPTIEYIIKAPKTIQMHGIGDLEKGNKVQCSEELAAEFAKDRRFKIEGLKATKGGSE